MDSMRCAAVLEVFVDDLWASGLDQVGIDHLKDCWETQALVSLPSLGVTLLP